jgi:hypothetical protein
MKKLVLITFCITIWFLPVYAQTKSGKQALPTRKELDDAIKSMQKMMENMSPEDKKAMEEMGVKTPSFDKVPDANNPQVQKAFEDENRIVPLKDVEGSGILAGLGNISNMK